MNDKEEKFKNHVETFTLGNLNPKETQELLSLEYVLTWGYDEPRDLERFKELSEKRWNEKLY
jgi:hypothetical protein